MELQENEENFGSHEKTDRPLGTASFKRILSLIGGAILAVASDTCTPAPQPVWPTSSDAVERIIRRCEIFQNDTPEVIARCYHESLQEVADPSLYATTAAYERRANHPDQVRAVCTEGLQRFPNHPALTQNCGEFVHVAGARQAETQPRVEPPDIRQEIQSTNTESVYFNTTLDEEDHRRTLTRLIVRSRFAYRLDEGEIVGLIDQILLALRELVSQNSSQDANYLLQLLQDFPAPIIISRGRSVRHVELTSGNLIYFDSENGELMRLDVSSVIREFVDNPRPSNSVTTNISPSPQSQLNKQKHITGDAYSRFLAQRRAEESARPIIARQAQLRRQRIAVADRERRIFLALRSLPNQNIAVCPPSTATTQGNTGQQMMRGLLETMMGIATQTRCVSITDNNSRFSAGKAQIEQGDGHALEGLRNLFAIPPEQLFHNFDHLEALPIIALGSYYLDPKIAQALFEHSRRLQIPLPQGYESIANALRPADRNTSQFFQEKSYAWLLGCLAINYGFHYEHGLRYLLMSYMDNPNEDSQRLAERIASSGQGDVATMQLFTIGFYQTGNYELARETLRAYAIQDARSRNIRVVNGSYMDNGPLGPGQRLFDIWEDLVRRGLVNRNDSCFNNPNGWGCRFEELAQYLWQVFTAHPAIVAGAVLAARYVWQEVQETHEWAVRENERRRREGRPSLEQEHEMRAQTQEIERLRNLNNCTTEFRECMRSPYMDPVCCNAYCIADYCPSFCDAQYASCRRSYR